MSDTPRPAPPTVHELKCWPSYFDAIKSGAKSFEARFDDRGFKVGDVLRLREFAPEIEPPSPPEGYTGRVIEREVTYILRGPAFGIERHYVVMALSERGEAVPRG
jgi:hypothetical protein